jgi:hypothetical protein
MKQGLYWEKKREMEKLLLPDVIARHKGSLSAAAEELGIHRISLRTMLKDNGIYIPPETRIERQVKSAPRPKKARIRTKKSQKSATYRPKPVISHSRIKTDRKIAMLREKQEAEYSSETASLIAGLCHGGF